MNIKQIEEITAMTRANIRYYESEGLICPKRNPDNGYRDYSQEDAETLLKIRLLRCLDISIEDVKAIQAGTLPMEEALRRSLVAQEAKQNQIRRTTELARQMLGAGVDYKTLDAAAYLRQLEAEEILQQDQVDSPSYPWRRFFARDLDFTLYACIATPLLWNVTDNQYVSLFAHLALMLLLEPLQLRLFGTTIGKAILGLRVTDLEERKLRYSAGLERTWTVLWEGCALRILIIQYYFLYKSYKLCEDGEYLPWEWDSEVTCKDEKIWRVFVYILVMLAAIAVEVLLVLKMEGIL